MLCFQNCHRRLLSLLLLVSLALAYTSSARAEGVIRVVADEWPPFSGSELPSGGISLDVIETVLTKAGYNVKTDIVPWARIMAGASEGGFDVVGSLFMDEELQKSLIYGAPFYATEIHFVRQKGSTTTFSDLASLKPYSIAVGDGFLYEPAFDAMNSLNKVTVTTTLQGLRMVGAGRADLTLDSMEVLTHSLQLAGGDLADRVEILPGVLAKHEIHMAVSKTLPNSNEIVDDFNRVLAEMQADGSLDELLRKHIAP